MGHDPLLRRTRLPAPTNLPGRRSAGPRLRPPHRPPGGALVPQGWRAHRGPAAAALPGSRLVPGPSGEGAEAARRRAKGPLLHLHHQAPPDRRRNDGHPRRGSPGGPPPATSGYRTARPGRRFCWERGSCSEQPWRAGAGGAGSGLAPASTTRS